MNIAVFSDKFSGTLSAIEVLDIVQSKFLDSNINADFIRRKNNWRVVEKF